MEASLRFSPSSRPVTAAGRLAAGRLAANEPARKRLWESLHLVRWYAREHAASPGAGLLVSVTTCSEQSSSLDEAVVIFARCMTTNHGG
jgi:hypothetical protein